MPYLAGAIPTPRARLAAATPFIPIQGLIGAPPSWGVIPQVLSVWLNDTYGDCVTAEEAFAKAAWSVKIGGPELVIPDGSVKTWAKSHGVLNGAVIEDVLKWMQHDPIAGPDGHGYTDGSHNSVDWTNDAVLSAAIYLGGAVKIGVASAQLEGALNSTHGKSGWLLTGARHDGRLDHCVALCGYGPASDCFARLNVPFPTGKIAPTAICYNLFTWGTIGVIDQPSLIAITGEAWVRTPTTPEQPEPAPPQPPAPPTPPQPPGPTPGPVPATGLIQIDLGTQTISAPQGWSLVPRI